MDENPIQKAIEDSSILFSALQTVGNKARSTVGYNKPYEFAPGQTASYELYTTGPDHPYHGQYAYLNDEELGEKVTLATGLTLDEMFRKTQNLFKRIVITTSTSDGGNKPVCIIQGKEAFQMALHIPGPWEDELKEWFEADGGVQR